MTISPGTGAGSSMMSRVGRVDLPAGDFVVTQVVDDVKGVHCLIRKEDFARWA